ncbi:ABC transporter ATP-binding protein [Marinimicrococcus flavescens]|uniref:ATP-binding cassette domain-containing protein n=1 Tax=Marinimicrococcus flavescens TaxID=3031815 RepID=A0AAP3XQE6_9PROT|nr:ATP-binding cassette domain-containing protein [Marinimicrococcus flavescens]
MTAPLVTGRGLRMHFPIRRGLLNREVGRVRAVEDVDLAIAPGEVLGVVGESGSGKSTLGRMVLRLLEPTAGRVVFDGTDITGLKAGELRAFRRHMQMIFQDPFSSLNPRMTIRATIGEAVRLHGLARGSEVDDRVAEALAAVGLARSHMHRYPKAFSGGQRQRLAIARALVVQPRFIVADEPVSALDVSIQAEIINLLDRLRRELQLTMMFISHDLAVVELISDRVLVLYLGRVMEIGPAQGLFALPLHPYSRALIDAVPGRHGRGGTRRLLGGEIPSPANPPRGCVFRTRCPHALPACAETVPALREMAPGRFKACIRDDLDLAEEKAA